MYIFKLRFVPVLHLLSHPSNTNILKSTKNTLRMWTVGVRGERDVSCQIRFSYSWSSQSQRMMGEEKGTTGYPTAVIPRAHCYQVFPPSIHQPCSSALSLRLLAIYVRRDANSVFDTPPRNPTTDIFLRLFCRRSHEYAVCSARSSSR